MIFIPLYFFQRVTEITITLAKYVYDTQRTYYYNVRYCEFFVRIPCFSVNKL